MEKLIDITVIWKLDGPFMCTLLQYPDTEETELSIKGLTVKDYVEQAYDVEFPDEPNLIAETGWDCIAVIRGAIEYLY